jgi:hypothetical protein
MKPGDLVRLKQTPMSTREGVRVSFSRPVVGGDDVEGSEDDEAPYPVGTVAVFLDTKQRTGMKWNISWILLEGRVGWVWEEELEEMQQEQS